MEDKDLKIPQTIMPVLFIGHGTPMNAIEENEFSMKWKEISKKIPKPKAILCISAHWETAGTEAGAMDKPETIHDFGGFPVELYKIKYPVNGNPQLAQIISDSLPKFQIKKDYTWGLDHGAWCFIRHMYPKADIPVLQLSIDYNADMQYHYSLAKGLSFLRTQGVLVVGSGNMVHNLRAAEAGENGFNTEYAYDWAQELNELFKEKILERDHAALVDYTSISDKAYLGIPSEEHYIPLIYSLALQTDDDKITLFNDKIVGGSISMTSLFIGNEI